MRVNMEEKQVYENQETAIKLLEENVKLKKQLDKAKTKLKQMFLLEDDSKIYDDLCELCKILEVNRNE